MSDIFVRLQPVNPRRGITVQGYTYREFSFRGGERPTWYEVEQALADELAKFHQKHDDPQTPVLFQVCDRETKERLERGEQEKYLAALGAVTATVSLPKQFAEPQTISLAAPPAPLPPLTATAAPPHADVPDRGAAIPSSRSGGRKVAKAAERGALTTEDIPGQSDDE